VSDFASDFVFDFASDFASVSFRSCPCRSSPRFCAAVPEVGGVPAAAFQVEPAAVIILREGPFLALGQTVITGSLILCRYSFWNPQDVQRYS